MDIDIEQEKQARYIHFKFPESQMTPNPLKSETEFIPALGRVEVIGYQAFKKEADSDKGVTVKNGSIVYDSAEALSSLGLSNLTITITGPKQDIICKIKIPGINQQLVGIAKYIPDEFGEDEFEKHKCYAFKWSTESHKEELPLFVPIDPAFLNSLGVRFETSATPDQNLNQKQQKTAGEV